MDGIYQALLFVNGSVPVDSLGTSYNVSINGIEQEGNAIVKKQIEEEGIWRRLYKKIPIDIIIVTTGTLLFYGLDNLLKIDDQSINFHKSFAYGLGGIKYFMGVGHFLVGTSGIVERGLEGLVEYFNKDRNRD